MTAAGGATVGDRISSPPDDLPPSTAPVLEAVRLTKRFSSRIAVDGVSLSVRAGHLHGLLGPNGAGKTTTLRMLLGVVRPDSGAVLVNGRPLSASTPRGRCGIAGFAETPHFYPYLTASRNVELLSAWDGPVAHAKVEEMLDLVGLAPRAQTKVGGFSTGMRQRLGLAAALISEPQILIVDEPSTGLDPAGIRDLHALLADLAGSGRTVLVSSHDLGEVEKLCDDVTVLKAGQVVHNGSMTALRERAPGRSWHLRTSDDRVAVDLATQHPDLQLGVASGALTVRATVPDLDRFVLALAHHGTAVRELRQEELPLESLFFGLTRRPDADGMQTGNDRNPR